MKDYPLGQPALLNIGPPTYLQGDAACFDTVEEAITYAIRELSADEREGTYVQLETGDTICWDEMERIYEGVTSRG